MTTILKAVGDISFGSGLFEMYTDKGPEYPFENVLGALRDCDVLFGNMESVMRPDDFPEGKLDSSALQSSEQAIDFIKPAGFDILNHAANHVLDCGSYGLENTREKILQAGALPLGTGTDRQQARKVQVVEKNDITMGFLGYLEESNPTLSGGGGRIAYFRPENVLGDVIRNRDSVDFLCVSIHADLEFRKAPSIPRVDMCRKIAEAGADLILCHHPHIPQGIEKWGSCVIAYSLGNFIFKIGDYQGNSSPHTYKSTIFTFTIEGSEVVEWEREPFTLDKEDFRPTPLSDAERSDAETYFRDVDSILQDPDELRQAWYETSLDYMDMIMNIILRDRDHTSAQDLIKNHLWRYLVNPESLNWVAGIREMAQAEYEKNSREDFQFVRPNFPFQD